MTPVNKQTKRKTNTWKFQSLIESVDEGGRGPSHGPCVIYEFLTHFLLYDLTDPPIKYTYPEYGVNSRGPPRQYKKNR